jgi:formate dehydrogenase major subunit/formate dehydrogenase alpha subunit
MSKFARQVLRTNNIDSCEHVHRASVVDGLDATLGLHAQSNTIEDVARQSKAVLLIGSNTTEQHPIFGVKLRLAVLRRGCQLVVAHPDFINMSEYATLRLVHRAGTESALVNGMMHVILERGWEDRTFIQGFTQGFDEFSRGLGGFAPAAVAKLTGVSEETIQSAAELLAKARPTAIVWGPDLMNLPSGRQAIASLVNLQLLLGNFGVPGGGLIPLRSQNNSQGASDMGGHPAYYPGYQSVTSDATRRKFEGAWGRGLPARAGMTASQMMEAAVEGRLKALYILCEDLVTGAVDGSMARRGLHSCDFVVLQGVFESETSRIADVHLPGVTFAEKTGTFTNTERRVQMVRQAIAPQGESRPDWQIIAELARRIKAVDADGEHGAWDYADTAQIMAEAAALTPIYAGISHDRLEHDDPPHWPVNNLSHPGTPILTVEDFKGGRGRFTPVEHGVAEA